MPDRHREERNLLFAGGGTGGHIFPALVVGRELEQRGWRVSWTGRPRGMERDLIARERFPYYPLAARAWVGRGVAARAAALCTLTLSAVRARRLVRRTGTRIVFGTGGYVSVPGVLGGRLAGRSVLLFEPNARAGAANRWLSRFSGGVLLGYDETAPEFACRTWATGIPVRPQFHRVGEAPAPPADGLVLVLGGSQGALQINRLIPSVCELLAGRVERLRILHQAGRAHVEDVRRDYDQRDLADIEVEVVPFIDDMASAMGVSRVVVSRAGALTLAEISAAARPSVLIPLSVAGGHQRANAERLVRAGAAEMLSSEDATAERLGEVLSGLLTDSDRCRSMGQAARQLARPGAAKAIADVVESVGRAR